MGRISRANTFFGDSAPSFESWPAVEEGEVELLVADQADDLAQADATMDTVYDLQERADTVDETAAYIDNSINQQEGGASEGEVGLAEQVADLATQGTGEDSETVMPAVESYIGSKISTEGFKQVIRNTIEAIKRALASIFARIKAFWRKMTSRLSALVRAAEDIKKRARDAQGKSTKEKKIELSGGTARLLSYAGQPVKTGDAILAGFKELADVADKASNKWAASVAGAGEKIADALGDFDPEKAVSELSSLNAKMGKLNPSSDVTSLSSSSDSRYKHSGITLQSSKELLGGKSVFAQASDYSGNDPKEKARAIQMERVFLADSKKDQKEPEKAEVEVFSPGKAADLAEEVIRTAGVLRKYGEGKGLNDLEKARKKVESAADRMLGKQKSDDISQENQTCTRLAFQFGSTFVDWSHNPHTSLSAHTVAVARAALTAAGKSLSQYTAA